MDKKGQFFERLFKARYHSVYSFFLKKLGSSEDAADGTQETFMRMMRHNDAISLNAPESHTFSAQPATLPRTYSALVLFAQNIQSLPTLRCSLPHYPFRMLRWIPESNGN